MTDFAALIRRLVDSGVDFILVGGLAAAVHGSARLTRDVDVLYARTSGNIHHVVSALAPYQSYLRELRRGAVRMGRTHGLCGAVVLAAAADHAPPSRSWPGIGARCGGYAR